MDKNSLVKLLESLEDMGRELPKRRARSSGQFSKESYLAKLSFLGSSAIEPGPKKRVYKSVLILAHK